jgi:hypothetical protein
MEKMVHVQGKCKQKKIQKTETSFLKNNVIPNE